MAPSTSGPVRNRPLCWAAVAIVLVGLSACTGGTTVGSTGTVALSSTASTAAPAADSTQPTPTPVTPDGMTVGPGVTDTSINLGLIVAPGRDRGFSAGVELWQQSVNAAGGVCGRSVSLVLAGAGENAATAYERLARGVLGFLALTDPDDDAGLAARSAADRVPVLQASGSSADLTTTGPVILGATDDITVINSLAYLIGSRKVLDRASIGILSDGSPAAANGLAGARWWAARTGATLEVRSTASGAPGGWGPARAVLVLADPAQVGRVLTATASAITVVTTLDGYDPKQVPVADAERLLVMAPTPAFGSDHPAAAAVAKAFTQLGRHDPGPRLLSGYAVAGGWGRILTQACTDRSLTRDGIIAALTSVGPSSPDSLFGPSDPALVLNSALPATRVSSIALADPSAPGGLKPLIWLQAAPGIGDYVPVRNG